MLSDGVGANIAIVAGEASGDAYGAALVEALRRRLPSCAFWGVGGDRMRRSGVELLADSSAWGAIGIVAALRAYPHVRYVVYPSILRAIRRRRPAVVIPIDFGAMNVRVAKHSRRSGIPVLYYLPPGSWRSSGPIRANLAEFTDRIAAQFPWAAERLNSVGAHAEFVGHPLLDLVGRSRPRAEFVSGFGLDESAHIISLLPGSRRSEVANNLPAMLEAAHMIHRELPGSQFVVVLAPSVSRAMVERVVERGLVSATSRRAAAPSQDRGARPERARDLVTPEGCILSGDAVPRFTRAPARRVDGADVLPVVIAEGAACEAMRHSDVVVSCSGTATLEAAIAGTPLVVIYRCSRLMTIEGYVRRAYRIPHVSLPNIVAGRTVVPELLGPAATPHAIASSALRYLTDSDAALAVRKELALVRHKLGEPGATERVADMVMSLVGSASRSGAAVDTGKAGGG